MSEVIVKMKSDHVIIKNGEYVRDLVRCEDCTYKKVCRGLNFEFADGYLPEEIKNLDFCSYGELEEDE